MIDLNKYAGELPELPEHPTFENMCMASTSFFNRIQTKQTCMREFHADNIDSMNNHVLAWVNAFIEIWEELE